MELKDVVIIEGDCLNLILIRLLSQLRWMMGSLVGFSVPNGVNSDAKLTIYLLQQKWKTQQMPYKWVSHHNNNSFLLCTHIFNYILQYITPHFHEFPTDHLGIQTLIISEVIFVSFSDP